MSNVVSSAIFCVRNVDMAENQGKIGRIGVAAGQVKKVFDYVSGIDGKIGKTAQEATSIMQKAAKNEKLLTYAGKAVDFASRNINPLICVSAGIDVLRAEDKTSAVIENTTALAAMFTAEKYMKNYMDEIPKMDFMKNISEKVMNFAKKNKIEGRLPGIIKGVAFVAGSCVAYGVGKSFGELLTGNKTESKIG